MEHLLLAILALVIVAFLIGYKIGYKRGMWAESNRETEGKIKELEEKVFGKAIEKLERTIEKMNRVPELGSETPIKGKRYKWNDIGGRRKYTAIFIKMDNGTAIMKMDNGELKGVTFDIPGK